MYFLIFREIISKIKTYFILSEKIISEKLIMRIITYSNAKNGKTDGKHFAIIPQKTVKAPIPIETEPHNFPAFTSCPDFFSSATDCNKFFK